MPSLRFLRTTAFALVALVLFSLESPRGLAQAALLMEQPYGFFGALNPTGHTAIYFAHVCAETPLKLRRCAPGEPGAVIARYQGLNGYDWIAIPLVPYLYSVEDASEVPKRVTHEEVMRMRDRYHEQHLMGLGENLSRGGLLHGGWAELVGVSYERRIYAFTFETTEAQDDAFIARMNGRKNRSHFHLLFNNCADFARTVLNEYFPHTFNRSIFPDAGMTTPKQVSYKLVRYARKHPELALKVYEIPQIPGNRRMSRSNKSISESLVTTVYAIPIVIVNPYLAGGLFVDYLVRGRHSVVPKHPAILEPQDLAELTAPAHNDENPVSAGLLLHAAGDLRGLVPTTPAANSSLLEVVDTHEH